MKSEQLVVLDTVLLALSPYHYITSSRLGHYSCFPAPDGAACVLVARELVPIPGSTVLSTRKNAIKSRSSERDSICS